MSLQDSSVATFAYTVLGWPMVLICASVVLKILCQQWQLVDKQQKIKYLVVSIYQANVLVQTHRIALKIVRY
jgi:hypothetical protein